MLFVVISCLNYIRAHNNYLCDLFKQDADILFSGNKPEEMLLNKRPHEIDKDRIYQILELIRTRKYYNSEIKALVNDIQRYLDRNSVGNENFWTPSLDRYKYLVNYNQRSPFYTKEEFSYFFTPAYFSLLLSITIIKFSDKFFISPDFVVNIMGLIGSVIIFYYGIPNKIDTGGAISLCIERQNLREIFEIQRYKNISAVGLGLIAGSFLVNIFNLCLK